MNDFKYTKEPVYLKLVIHVSQTKFSLRYPFNRFIIAVILNHFLKRINQSIYISKSCINLVYIPSRRDTNDWGSKGSKSSKCSPVPIKIMGEFVAETADIAPPPLACPSNFVIMTLPTFTALQKANA